VLEDVVKVFPNGTVAVRGVSMSLYAGAVHGLVGANGAGKSTLIKIISGAVGPSSGRMIWRGREVRWSSPAEPLRSGIATVHQHTPLVPTVSVLENVFLGARQRWRWSVSERLEQFKKLLLEVDYEIDPERRVGDLSVGERQMVALLKALSEQPSLLVLDEPTASLAHEERRIVFRAVQGLAHRSGKSVLYVSHLLGEVMGLTDQVTVLRDGCVALDRATSGVSESDLVESIVGRTSERPGGSHGPGEGGGPDAAWVLEVERLRSPGVLAETSFAARKGEVLGIAGLLGSGRSELLQAVFGADPRANGVVRVNGRKVRLNSGAMVKAGVALVPEDRNRQGLVLGWEIWRNMTLPSLGTVSWQGLLPRRSSELARAEEAIRMLSIKAPSPESLVSELSGGNAQKVLFAKWLFPGLHVLLLDEPTAGIDVGAKRDIQSLIRRLANEGLAVVVVDSELDELLLVSDRVLVMHGGTVVAERQARETNEQELVALASGLTPARAGAG
jgi:ribose transport system ATP-binding protein